MKTLPNISPRLALNFKNSESVLPLISVVRPGNLYVHDNGRVLRFGPNTPPICSKGLKLERSAKNLVIHSATGNTNERGSIITGNAGQAPDGSNTATLVAAKLTNTSHGIHWNMRDMVTGKVYTASAYVKPLFEQNPFVQITWHDGATAISKTYANYNLVTGECRTFGEGTYSATIEKLSGGWCRITKTVLVEREAVNQDFSIEFVNTITSGRRAGFLGTEQHQILVWMPQVELGPYATSPIASVVDTITSRPSTRIRLPINGIISYKNSTVIAEITRLEDVGVSGDYMDFFDASIDGITTVSEGPRLSVTTMSNNQHRIIGNGNTRKEEKPIAIGQRHVVGASMSEGTIITYSNGDVLESSNAIGLDDFNILDIGTSRSGGSPASGWLHSLVVYPEALSVEELKRLCDRF